jgi:hypothetical protein
MRDTRRLLFFSGCLALASSACSAPTLSARGAAAAPSIAALREGAFSRANEEAEREIRGDSGNPYARLVRAITRYEQSAKQTSLDLRTTVIGAVAAGGFNAKYLREALEQSETDLAKVEDDLAVAAEDPSLAMELCLACWEIDWNGDGRVDDRDRLLFQIERDEQDRPIPEADPRRKPTFRFDTGDVAWARAWVSFQRALTDVALAYDPPDLQSMRREGRAVIKLARPERIAAARARILEGLDRSDEARRDYLAETDDDREWVPSPTQRSHPMPLPVDAALYATWEAVVDDLRKLVRGEEGLRAADLYEIAAGARAGQVHGFIDVGGLLAHPHDIVLRVDEIDELERRSDGAGVLRAIFGEHYVPSMRPSKLPDRLRRMKGEIDRDVERLDRKLRYLFWLN